MSRDDGDHGRGLSRRALLARAAVFGVGSFVSADIFRRQAALGSITTAAAGGQAALRGEPATTLTAAEAAILDAIVARLIPTDDSGPGAVEAGAARYIDRALGGALAASREAYRNGLAAVDAYARASRGAPFAQLPATDQDAVLRDMEANIATGFVPDALTFFNLVRAHTIEGTFGDPYYGGNVNFVGWDLIAYPGIRLVATADDQRLNRRPARVRRSAYDHAMFSRSRPG